MPLMIAVTNYFGPPNIIRQINVGNIDLLNQPGFKYADINFGYNLCDPQTRKIIDSFNIQERHKKILLDVKYLYLQAGWASCLLGWHIDCTKDLAHKSNPEIHHLWFSGAEANTIFLAKGVSSLSEIKLPWIAPENHYIRYGRNHLHSASVAKKSGWRLIIRVTETDFIRPDNRIHNFVPNKIGLRL